MKYLAILLSLFINYSVYAQPDIKAWNNTVEPIYQDSIHLFTPDVFLDLINTIFMGNPFNEQCLVGLADSATEEINSWYNTLHFLWFNESIIIYPHDIAIFRTIMTNVIDDVISRTLDSAVYWCME